MFWFELNFIWRSRLGAFELTNIYESVRDRGGFPFYILQLVGMFNAFNMYLILKFSPRLINITNRSDDRTF